MSDPSTLVLAGFGAVFLFWFRSRATFYYGLFEISSGMGIMSFAVLVTKADALAKMVATLGGAYSIVRGLDNMDRRLPKSFRTAWDAIFPKEGSGNML